MYQKTQKLEEGNTQKKKIYKSKTNTEKNSFKHVFIMSGYHCLLETPITLEEKIIDFIDCKTLSMH